LGKIYFRNPAHPTWKEISFYLLKQHEQQPTALIYLNNCTHAQPFCTDSQART